MEIRIDKSPSLTDTGRKDMALKAGREREREPEKGTLPLFDDLDPARDGSARVVRAGVGATTVSDSASPQTRDSLGDQHLRAAFRLSRAMWRFPDHSPQQTRAGLAICRHLQALLAESEDRPPR